MMTTRETITATVGKITSRSGYGLVDWVDWTIEEFFETPI